MEEADRIILETLKTLGCRLNDDIETGEAITRVGQMTCEVVVAVVGKLVGVIDASLHPPSSLPPAMAARFRVASELAEVVKSLGYEGDVGYQTLLWVEEGGVRAVLLFLVAKLPRETAVEGDVVSKRGQLMKRVAGVLKKQIWKPPYLHDPADDTFSFTTHPLFIPFILLNGKASISPAQKNYYSQNRKSLYQQIQQQQIQQQPHQQQQIHQQQQPHQQQQQHHPQQQTNNIKSTILSSILEHNLLLLLKQQHKNNKAIKTTKSQDLKKRQTIHSTITSDLIKASSSTPSSSFSSSSSSSLLKPLSHVITKEDKGDDKTRDNDDGKDQNKLPENTTNSNKTEDEGREKDGEERGRLEGQIVRVREGLARVDVEVADQRITLQQERVRMGEKEGVVEEGKKKMKMKKAVLKLLPDAQQAVNQMQEMITEMRKELDGTRERWMEERGEMEGKVEEEVMKKKMTMSMLESKSEELQLVDARLKELTSQALEKQALHKELTAQYDRRTEGKSRSSYNKRILEIVNNIHKQHQQIEKIIEDTRVMQGDVNRLAGVLSRSFVVADELIFKAAQKDETARKAYKLLACLHESCGEIVEMVEEIGEVRKVMADVQEELVLAKDSKVAENLKQIEQDLQGLRKENQGLMKQLKEQIAAS